MERGALPTVCQCRSKSPRLARICCSTKPQRREKRGDARKPPFLCAVRRANPQNHAFRARVLPCAGSTPYLHRHIPICSRVAKDLTLRRRERGGTQRKEKAKALRLCVPPRPLRLCVEADFTSAAALPRCVFPVSAVKEAYRFWLRLCCSKSLRFIRLCVWVAASPRCEMSRPRTGALRPVWTDFVNGPDLQRA
jgi:hypothetical protein